MDLETRIFDKRDKYFFFVRLIHFKPLYFAISTFNGAIKWLKNLFMNFH